MKFPRRKHAARHMMLELTPMIDVVFLLIIFFMTVSQMTKLDVEEVSYEELGKLLRAA